MDDKELDKELEIEELEHVVEKTILTTAEKYGIPVDLTVSILNTTIVKNLSSYLNFSYSEIDNKNYAYCIKKIKEKMEKVRDNYVEPTSKKEKDDG